jgi:phytoene dehydrogenase-like protein
MTSGPYDIIVAGAGHNGLLVAAYLARAGLNVCVVEKQDMVGGGAITRELTMPGFKHDPASIMLGLIQANPVIANDELGLISKYGLKYHCSQDQVVAFLFPDGRALVFHRDMAKTCESIRQFSKKDAETYPKYCAHVFQLLQVANVDMFSPPPPLGRFISLLEGTELGREYLRIMLSSLMDIVHEWFESDRIQAAFARFAAECGVDAWQPGTGLGFLWIPYYQMEGCHYPEGGSGALTEKLASFIKDNGGEIRLSSPVKSIKVVDGEAKGVILADGEEILAKTAVVSSLNPKQLFVKMMSPDVLPAGFPDKVNNLRADPYSGIMFSIALNDAPKYKSSADCNKTAWVNITPATKDLMRMCFEMRCGIPCVSTPLIITPTLLDNTRAPDGKHVLYVFHVNPYRLSNGGPARWDEIKEKVADDVLATIRTQTENMGSENILGMHIISPLDMERANPAMNVLKILSTSNVRLDASGFMHAGACLSIPA